jgi:hypothetical protein
MLRQCMRMRLHWQTAQMRIAELEVQLSMPSLPSSTGSKGPRDSSMSTG